MVSCGVNNKTNHDISEDNFLIGLYDKNSDKMFVPIHAQLLSESTQEWMHNEKE